MYVQSYILPQGGKILHRQCPCIHYKFHICLLTHLVYNHTYLTYNSTLLDLLSFLPCLLQMLLFFSPHLLASTGVQPVLSHMLFYHAGFKKYYFPHDSTFYFVLIASPSFIPSFPDISSSGILLSLPNLVAYPACLTW